MTDRGSVLTLPVPADFDLSAAVCGYGYFLLAPNRWQPRRRRLVRPMRGAGDRLVTVAITQAGRRLRLRCDRRVDRREAGDLRRRVARMLRVDDDLRAWYRLEPAARRRRFGRLFRSPTLFEDMVKTITSCNVAWPNTRRMNVLLCAEVGGGGFPGARQLASITPARLKRVARVGYRAERILRLARDVDSGRLDLAWFADRQRNSDELADALLRIHGIGPYAAANLCVMLGHYDRLPIDTETIRHYLALRGRKRPDDAAGLRRLHRSIERHYARYGDHRFLAYWFELWTAYERHVGKPSDQWENSDGDAFTAANYA